MQCGKWHSGWTREAREGMSVTQSQETYLGMAVEWVTAKPQCR